MNKLLTVIIIYTCYDILVVYVSGFLISFIKISWFNTIPDDNMVKRTCQKLMIYFQIGRGQRSHQDLPRPRRPYSYDVSDESGKQHRRLTKKLYEIKGLQQKEDNGDVLEKNQMEKIRQKHKYEEELRDLEMELQKMNTKERW